MRSMQKRLGVIAGFLVILVLLAINTAILRRQLAVQVGNQEWFSHQSPGFAGTEKYRIAAQRC